MNQKNSTRRDFLKNITLGATGFALASSCTSAKHDDRPSKPNIVLIIGDDISVDDFGCYGHPHIRTPNIDTLAANGMRFTNAYLTISSCSPSRCSIISGRYPHNTGAPEQHQPLPAGQPMFPLELKKAGYYTVAYKKWHMGNYAKTAFDNVLGGSLTDRLSNKVFGGDAPGGEERWVRLLQTRPKDQPFFMWFASSDAHRPWQKDDTAKKHKKADAVVPPYMADMDGTRMDLALYYDEIQRLDRYVGLVVKELKKQEVLDNTIIMFIADNGRPFPRGKRWLYDSGIKTPLIICWPKGIAKPGSTSHSLVSAIDIAPTILELAALKTPKCFQGISITPLLKDPEASIRNYVFAEQNWHNMESHQRMVRWKKWVYIRNARPSLAHWDPAKYKSLSYQDLLVLQKKGKLTPAQADVFLAPRPVEMLFNIENDYHQLNNLAEQPEQKEILAQMREILNEWQQRTGDTVPANLTKDIIDRKTYELLGNFFEPTYGVTPGSERNATSICDPGPR